MDNQSDEYKAVINRAYHFLAVLQSFRGFISSLIGFFIFTEDDKLKAGIAGNKGDGQSGQHALVVWLTHRMGSGPDDPSHLFRNLCFIGSSG